MADILALAEVWLWNQRVGAVAEETSGTITFEYDPKFARRGWEISPFNLPLSLQGPVVFPALRRLEAFSGLPGVLADALPDRFGNAVIRAYFERKGQLSYAMSPVQKLLYLGNRAMGAIEFRPALKVKYSPQELDSLEVSRLVEEARRLVEGKVDVAVPHIMRLSASAGGARAKAVILWNPAANRVRSGFVAPEEGDEHWLIKFDGVGDLDHPDPNPQPYNRIEYVYGLLARQAGIDMAEMRLLEERRLAHLMVKRFDRVDGAKLHMHSLGGLEHVDYNLPGQYSYEQYLRTVLRLNLGHPALEQAFRRAVFNIMVVNQDDHVKNFSFLMDDQGAWRLSPAYDITYARGSGYTRTHQMTFNGKSDGFTRDDMKAVGALFGLKGDGMSVVDEVAEALAEWPALAEKWGIPRERIDAIGAQMRCLR